jgi:hypothetical protein
MKLEMDEHEPEKRTELALEIYERYSKVYYIRKIYTMKLSGRLERLTLMNERSTLSKLVEFDTDMNSSDGEE